MEEMKIRDERARHVELMVPTFLPSDFIHLLLHLNTSESLFLCPHFEFVPLNLSVLPLSCPTTAVYADLLPSLTLFRSRLYSSFPRTDNKASLSMADLQFTPPCAPSHTRDSEGELQLRLQCGVVADSGPEFGHHRTSLLCTVQHWWGHVDSWHARTTVLWGGGVRFKMQERASSGKDLQFHLGQGDSSHMHSFLRQNQSKFWPSSYPTYALLWAYLTTLLWHRHIVDLCICQIILHANQMLQRREREFSFAAWPSLEEEHLFPNKSKIKKNDTPQLDCVSGNVGIWFLVRTQIFPPTWSLHLYLLRLQVFAYLKWI